MKKCFSLFQKKFHYPARVKILSGFVVLAFAKNLAVAQALPPLEQVVASKLDLWGEAALRETNGASYEFFEKLLPPPRYVNADFRFYPIVLSAPNSTVKARLISNGSGVNLSGGSRSWNDAGTAVTFRVGQDEFRFGDLLDRVSHPTLTKGYLPIVQIEYEHPTPRHDSAKTAAKNSAGDPAPEVYRLEAFASGQPSLASNGVIFAKFTLARGSNGIVTAQFDNKSVRFVKRALLDEKGQCLAWFGSAWIWERGAAHARIGGHAVATMAIATKPMPPGEFEITPSFFDEQRSMGGETWELVLSEGMNLETPEPLVNNAWKNLVIQDFAICNGSNLNYSAGNQYQKKYAAETSDAAVPLMSFGYENDMRRFLPVILDLVDHRLTNHFASHKLDTLCRFYWQTRDTNFVTEMRPRWQKELDWILEKRGDENGLLPKDNYCTDIEEPIYSLGANAKCWAALRDLIPILEAIGDNDTAKRVAEIAPKYKEAILAAADKSIRRDIEPPFVPMALFGAEEIHDPITDTRIGSYWDLVANYIIGSGIFSGTERETWIPKYFETHGGLCMGMTRSGAENHSFWTGKDRTNPLYGMRYVNDCLRRDEVERALVNFYGMLAHGMTRNTFIGAEGCSLQPLDSGGRFFYCPPNTASNGEWLWTLRHLLIQDFDLNNDGKPETLRLAFGTPRRWLEDGKIIKVENAPTAFGRMSYKIESQLDQGVVLAELDLPERNAPEKIFLRARVPTGWKVISATAGADKLNLDEKATVDISSLTGKQSIRFAVEKK